MIAIAGPTTAATPTAHARAIRWTDTATIAAAVGVILLAFGLRVIRLDAQSLWADEGASVVMTYRSVDAIAVAAAGDIHPPLYYWLLAGWANLVGRTEFALRFLSALQGVALVAVTYRLGRLLLDRPAALLGALFAAVSPLLIYYSQEARMYEQLALFGTAGALCAVLWWRAAAARARWWPWAVGVVVCFIAAMWSQFFAAGALLGASLAFVARFPNPFRHWRHWVAWAVSQLLVIAGVAPWLLYASNQLRSWAVDTEPLSATEFALRTLRYLVFGMAWDETVTGKTVALAVGLLLAAAVWPVVGDHRAVRTRGLAMTVLLALAPILLLLVVSQNRPVYHPKFLIGALPAFALLQGAGVAAAAGGASWLVARLAPSALRRPAAIVVVAVIVVGLLGAHAFAVGRALVAAYGDAKYARDDYRSIARYLETVSRPGDVILLNAPGQREIWDYYYRGNLPVVGLPGQRPAEDARTVADLVALTAQAKRVWVVFWAAEQADPRGVVERWLNEQTFRAANRWYGGVRLVLYSVPVQTEAGAIQSPREVVFEQGARLLGYSLATPSATPGDTLQLTLFWQGAQPLNERYTVFTHLIDPAELIWAQRDAEPGSGSRPTTEWRPGEVFADRYGLPVVTGAPPGEYVLEVGLYRASDGVRLGVVDEAGRVVADRVLLGPVSVDRPDRQPEVSALFIEHPRETPHGPLTFLGYDLQKLGFDRGVTDFRTGDLAHLTLFWRAPSRPGADRPLVLELRDSTGGRVAIRETRAVTNGLYPLSRWQAGDVVRDQHKLLLGVPAGQYRVFAGLEGERLMDLGPVTVR